MTAVAYLRKSSAPSKRVRTVSFEIQEQETRALAQRNGDTLTAVLSDWGKSGGSANRPDFQKLLAMVDAGDVRTIYSFSLSRLSRSLIDFADLLDRCRKHGVRIRLVQEGEIDWGTATGRAFANMAMVFAQFERELAAERNGAAAAERRERGDHLGQAPYGWTVVDGRLTPREGEDVDVIVAAFREAGGSFGATAKLLNERNVPTRRAGTKWNHSVVGRILRRQGPDDIRFAVKNTRAKAKPLAGAYFSGLLRCPCGGTLTPRKDDKAPTGVSGYYCSRNSRERHRKSHVSQRVILDWAKLEAERLRTPDYVVAVEKSQLERERLDAERTRIVDTFVAGYITSADRDRRMSAIASSEAALDAAEAMMEIPEVDWGKPPSVVNVVLRAMWDHVVLDEQLHPASAEWNVPEWRT
jgi:DNA invertase Pin-like site-specific DNA recombinase